MKRNLKFKLIVALVVYAMMPVAVKAHNIPGADSSLAAEIKHQLDENKDGLYYPKSVTRFYRLSGFQPAWIKSQGGMGPAWQAMLMIDCVLEFGLSHDDYHPKELTYNRLHAILDTPGKVNVAEQAHYEIMLTDAVITLMNHLHYGKLNPELAADSIDNGVTGKFNADVFLAASVKASEMMEAIASVQPKNEQYKAMQRRMHLLKGQYDGDCYEIPKAEVRKIAINMERLRWAAMEEGSYMHINVPAFTLKLHEPDSTYTFKVIVGKPANPTPTLQSNLTYFTTAPEWKVPQSIFVKELLPKGLADTAFFNNNNYTVYDKRGNYISTSTANLAKIIRNPKDYHVRQSPGCENALGAVVFRFNNPYDIYLHDTPEQLLFKKAERDFSHGCIRVERIKDLGTLLLRYDQSSEKITAFKKAIKAYQKQTFSLKTPLPIYITYITCEIKEGEMITYKDIYNLDKNLEMALYNANGSLVMN